MKRAVLALVLFTAACGGGSESEDQAAPAPKAPAEQDEATKAPVKKEAPKESSRCLPVPAADLAKLAEGAEPDVGKLTFSEGAAVKSKDFSSVYMIAGRFSAPGVEGEVGVWASNKQTVGEGLIMSVDGFAKQFTVWPDADKTDANVSQSDDGVSEAKDCLSN